MNCPHGHEIPEACSHPDCTRYCCAREEGRREGYAESLRWVEHYLAMPMHDSARGVLQDLHSRIAYEMEHGKSTSVLMEGSGSGCCANERKVGRNEGLALGVEAGHRNGYAECQRDVVAWLVASVPDGGGAGGQTLEATVGRERARDLRRAILAAARAIGLGNHVGKAKGGAK